MPISLEEYRSNFDNRSNYLVIAGVTDKHIPLILSFIHHVNRMESKILAEDIVLACIESIHFSGMRERVATTERVDISKDAVQPAPAARKEEAKQAAPATPPPETPPPAEETVDNMADWSRLPTVKAIVKKIVEGGTKKFEDILAKCEELQAMGVVALDVVPPADLPERVKSAIAGLG